MDELSAALRAREMRIVQLESEATEHTKMEEELEEYKKTEREMKKFKALGNVMNELRGKHVVTGAYNEGTFARKEKHEEARSGERSPREAEQGRKAKEEQKMPKPKEEELTRGKEAENGVARRRVKELEGEEKALVKNVKELTRKLYVTLSPLFLLLYSSFNNPSTFCLLFSFLLTYGAENRGIVPSRDTPVEEEGGGANKTTHREHRPRKEGGKKGDTREGRGREESR